ncbi:ABC transporter permease [Anaerocolumna chitinilytica]|uniref:ABC3 transporter permease C-terminal domain-containing protein n=1 Tax=Anaerocolumna chitinilytica TaxID=1727145 RepID=A0A7I8DLF8_9FIRM|nr:FtsX-like permease family protein [Anaerocolumna chitinilytica]BCJ99283.1 hypothetical protein bsdcttw_23240 [Anaerocolumna chitinilytica]
MNLREIARSGMKGRKKDALLLKMVVSLSFAFIAAALIFQTSMQETKTAQREKLYGSWQGAYLDGNDESYQKLDREKEIKELTGTYILGNTDSVGFVGTLPKALQDMSGFTLYQGRFPKKDNEILVELNQLSNAGLELKIGQKVKISLINVTEENSAKIAPLEQEYYQSYIKGGNLEKYGYHENPSADFDDIHAVVSTEYLYVFKKGSASDAATIKKKGLLVHQEIMLQKEFTICGILNTYSDKWDLGGHTVPNAFVTEEAGAAIKNAFYNNGYADVEKYQMPLDIFFRLRSLNSKAFHKLAAEYPDKADETESSEDGTNNLLFNLKKNLSDAEKEKISKYYGNPKQEASQEDTGLIKGSIIQGGDSTASFRKNSFSYPESGNSTEFLLTASILGIIFITTICAVFQIFLTQLRRRSRKLVLLKSIGATRGQLFGILFWEAVYLWRTGLLFGALGGSALSSAILYLLKLTGKESLVIAIPLKLLLLGIVIGSISLFLGILIPAIYAVNIPLTGTMEQKQKHTKDVSSKRNRKFNPKAAVHYVTQDFYHITIRYLKNSRGKNLLSFAISLFIISILTASLYLSYYAFSRYQESVVDMGRPDYTLKAIYGENKKRIPEINSELKKINGVKSVSCYKYGKNLLFWYDGIKKDTLLNTFDELLPDKLKSEHFAKYVSDTANQPEYITDAFYSYYYGLNPDTEEAKTIFSAITEGSINTEQFKKAEEVILLVPLYKQQVSEKKVIAGYDKIKAAVGLDKRFHWLLGEDKAYETSLDSRYKNIYDSYNTLKPGDTLYLSADKEKITESGKIPGFNTTSVKVGGIIHYFPEKGIWPFSNLTSCYTVIGSIDGMEKLYPNSKLGLFQVSINQMAEMVKILYPSSYGETLWNIKAEDKENPEVLDARLLTFANQYGFTLYNYKESSERILGEALNNILVIALLGLISTTIAFIAFYNTSISRMEQEKNRIGILQSIGVNKKQFAVQYMLQGALQGIAAVIAANAALFLLLFITTVFSSTIGNSGLGQLLREVAAIRLWKYPWGLHIGVDVIFIAIITVLQMIPAMRIARQYPVENIRSLGRG